MQSKEDKIIVYCTLCKNRIVYAIDFERYKAEKDKQHKQELRKMYDIKDSHCKSLEIQHKEKLNKLVEEIDNIIIRERRRYIKEVGDITVRVLEQVKQKIKELTTK